MKERLTFLWKLSLVSLFMGICLLSIPFLFTITTSKVASAAHVPPTPTPAPTPPPGTPWLLENYAQRTCVVQGRPDVQMVTYYGIWINGTWKQAINTSITNIPVGTQTWSTYTPIAPGSSDGIGSLAYEAVQVPSNIPLGTYTFQLTVTDGKLQQSVPVTLVVQASCVHY